MGEQKKIQRKKENDRNDQFQSPSLNLNSNPYLSDNRPESIQLHRLQEIADNSVQNNHIAQLQTVADSFADGGSSAAIETESQEQVNESSRFPESWSKKAKAFVWNEAGITYKRKNAKQTSDILPENLSSGDKETVDDASDVNFEFHQDSVISNTDVKLSTIDEVSPIQIKQLNPKGDKVRKFLSDECNQSWHKATKELNKDASSEIPEKKDNRRNMLRKIWEYRQWHHNFILNKTKNALGGDKLTDWAAAGSTTLTSDIDVNLKGTDTEAAVQKFNELFIADGWKYEAGIVYDVNVYALDFMYKEFTFGSGMVEKESQGIIDVTKDIHGNVLKKKDTVKDKTIVNNTTLATGIAAKEGARKGRAQGGFDGSNKDIIKEDAKDQDIWTHVKTRMYMSASEWESHASTIQLSDEIKEKVAARFEDFSETLKRQMLEDSPAEEVTFVLDDSELGIETLKRFSEKASDPTSSMDADMLEDESSNLMMAASNRIYEKKLVTIHELRGTLKEQIRQYDEILNNNPIPLSEQLQSQLDLINLSIESNLQLLRNMLAEAALFSNEAYISDGAVNHAVVGIQSGIKIKQKNSESKNAVVENLADSLKEISRHGGSLGEAAFKSGKYLFRLSDAAMNMGYSGDVISQLKGASFAISDTIKGNGSLTAEDKEAQSEDTIKRVSDWSSLTDGGGLKEKVKEVGQSVILWYNEQDEGFGQEMSRAVGNEEAAD